MKVTISWSGGKDSAFALHKILLSKQYDVINLHTVFGEETKRVGLHGIREELITQQAESLGIPLIKLYLKGSDNHDAYTKLMKTFYTECADNKIDGVVFGDIFLEDLKKFRETLLNDSGLLSIYPIWKEDTKFLVNDFICQGFKTLLCSADAKYFSAHRLGDMLDQRFMETLPEGVDACGENGEFHTFVVDGPIFNKPISVAKGESISKKYSYKKKNADGSVEQLESTFWFQDLMPLIPS